MISKIIKKEKERQEKLLKGNCPCEGCQHVLSFQIKEHKQSLINLKEYIGEIVPQVPSTSKSECDLIIQLVKDDEELTKMIERYE